MSAESKSSGWFWSAACAALALSCQAGAVAASGRGKGAAGFVAFQTMLSLTPWLGLLAAGSDKLAREHGQGAILAGYASFSRWALGLSLGGGLSMGLVAAWSLSEPAWPWALFCVAVAGVCWLGAGRESLVAAGRAEEAQKIYAAGLAFTLVAMAACAAWAPANLGALALAWTLPTALAGALCARRAKLWSAPPDRQGAKALRSRGLGLAAPFAAWATLCSFDVFAFRQSALGPDEISAYVLCSRAVSAAFVFSTVAAFQWVPMLVSQDPLVARRGFWRILSAHLTCSLAAATFVAFCGPWAFSLLIPSAERLDLSAAWLVLAALACARSLAESLLLASYGRSAKPAPWLNLGFAIAGVALFFWVQPQTWREALGWTALAWMAPAVAWSIRRKITFL